MNSASFTTTRPPPRPEACSVVLSTICLSPRPPPTNSSTTNRDLHTILCYTNSPIHRTKHHSIVLSPPSDPCFPTTCKINASKTQFSYHHVSRRRPPHLPTHTPRSWFVVQSPSATLPDHPRIHQDLWCSLFFFRGPIRPPLRTQQDLFVSRTPQTTFSTT